MAEIFPAMGGETGGQVSPAAVHETGVWPGGESGSPIVGAEAKQVEETRRKTWSLSEFEFCALQGPRSSLMCFDAPRSGSCSRPSATDYRRSRSSRIASVPFVVTSSVGEARSRRSPWGGRARPSGRVVERQKRTRTGSEDCNGRSPLVTSKRSPDATRRSYFDRFWRSSRTPTWLDPRCTPRVALLPQLLPD